MCPPYDASPDDVKNKDTIHPCDHCGQDDEPTHAVQSGGGFLTLCASCRAEVVGGS